MTRRAWPLRKKEHRWRWIRLSIAAVLLLVTHRTVEASGVEQVRQAWDLKVAFDSRWCGCGAGGYYPVRVRLTNRGPSRELTLCVNHSATSGTRVERRITVDQNETQFCSLSIPIVTNENLIAFSIIEKGVTLHEFDVNFVVVRNALPRPSLLVVDQDSLNLTAFENGASLFTANDAAMSSRGYHGGRADDSQLVGPSMLPDRWIDYSGLDVLAASFTTFKSLPAPTQNAILNWIETGGNLVIYELPAEQNEIERVLQVNERAYAAEGWSSDDETFGTARRTRLETAARVNHGSITSTTEVKWPNSAGSIQRRNLQLGRVSKFATNPFPGSTEDWACWIDATGLQRLGWSQRTGIAPWDGQQDFYEFLVPGVGDVPIFAFLGIVTVFTIVIGPINYRFFLRRKQLHLLLLTTPLIALLTSTLLFVYAAASDGFGIRSRTTSLTLLNQRSESAVTLQRLCLFAGLSPFGGLQFSNETAVFLLRPPDTNPGSYSVDLTQGQHLINGWLPSRVMSQYELVTRRKERTRVEVSRTSNDDELKFASSLPWNIQYLLLVDENGQPFYGEDVKAGDTVKLRIATRDDCKRMHDVAIKARPALPVDMSAGWSRRGRHYIPFQGLEPYVAKAQRERMLSPLYNFNTAQSPPFLVDRRHYLAILSVKPGLEQGVLSTPSVKDLNVLIGDY